uniref:UBP-type domain-containing protein n=1 Tax=Arundo donax TaxID=35708 RepID=A0A0A9E4W5_ARUDO
MDFQVSAETAVTTPDDSFELPTCPICIERMGQEISGLAVGCEHSSQCPCLIMWRDSSCSVCQFCKKQQTENFVCSDCCISENICMCMICGFLACGRYKGDHIKQHWKDSRHCYSMNLETNRLFYSMDDSANCLCHPIFSSKMETQPRLCNETSNSERVYRGMIVGG